MTPTEAPLDVLFDLIAQEASGELVSVSSNVEVHLYLQSGRVAWATDSSLPFAFIRHLLEHTTLTKETFHEILESCRRDRLPLGETLLAWQVVSLDEIRGALEHQIRGALTTLDASPDGRTIFLSRHREYASYDTRLTFDARELSPRGPRSKRLDRHGAPATPLLDRVREQLSEAAWLEALDGHDLIEHLPASALAVVSRVPTIVAERTVLDGADHVALRTARGTLLGTAINVARRSLWCRLRPESAFGIALSALCKVAGIDRISTPAPAPPQGWSKTPVQHTWGSSERPIEVDEMRTLMERASEIEGVLLFENDQPVCGAWRDRIDASLMSDIVRRRAPVLDVRLSPDPNEVGSDLEDLGYHLNSMVTGEAEAWCFGTELGESPRQSLWIFTDRASAQGLGWAYLTSLARQLAPAPKSARAVAE